MADDDGNGPDGEGRRLDGKPYKSGNTRADGSYGVGKNRPPEDTRFRKGDGRERGKRQKGVQNLDTIWSKQLKKKMTVDNRTQTKLEWAVEGTIRRAVTKSDRASEIVFSRADRLQQAKERTLTLSDSEVLDAWLAQRAQQAGAVTDDADLQSAEITSDETAGNQIVEGRGDADQ